MKNLEQREWVGVVVAILIVGFFFVFGQSIVGLFTKFNGTDQAASSQKPQLLVQDEVLGTGTEAVSGDRVTVNYTGHLVDGTIFDSSLARNEPFQFVLGVGQVIAGWDQGIVGMRVGGKRLLSIPPELGYGPNTYGPIPGNSTLIFEVELIKVEQ